MPEFGTPRPAAGKRGARGAGALLAVVALLWIAPLMTGHEPWLDEGYGFSLIYNILLSGDILVPTMAGLPFMEKPPLYYALAAGSAQVLQPWLALHDGARLINVPLTACCLIALAAAARRLYRGDRWLYAPLLFLGSLGTWDAFHRIITDVALVAGMAVALAGLVWADRRPLAGGFWLGTGAGIAFMSKGLPGPGMVGAGALLLPALSALYRRRAFVQTLAVAALAAAPWLLIWPVRVYLHSPELFGAWLWDNNFGRFFGSGLGPREQFGFYLTTLLWQAWPALPLAAWAMLQRYRQLPANSASTAASLAALALTGLAFALQADKVYALPLITWLLWLCRRADVHGGGGPWIAVVACFATSLLVLSSAGTSTEIYAMPLLVPLALLGAAALTSFPPRLAKWLDHLGVGVAALLIAGLWLGWLTVLLSWPAWLSDRLLARAPDFLPTFEASASAVALLATAGWLVCLDRMAPTPRGWVGRWLAGILTAGILLDALYAPAIDSTLTYRQVFQSLQRALPAEFDCISSRQVGESFRGMLQYRTGISLIDTEHSGASAVADCELRLLREGDLDLAPARDWELLWQGGRSGDYRVFHLFRRRDPPAPAP